MKFLGNMGKIGTFFAVWGVLLFIGLVFQLTNYVIQHTGFSFYVANTLAILAIIALPVIFYSIYSLIKRFLETH